MSDHKGTAIVTGASRGIGAAIATRLALDGFAVIVNFSASADEAETLVSTIEAAGGRARAVRADVADAGEVTALFDAAERAFGPIGVLVNNAGISRMAPLAQVSDADYQAHIAVNLTGTFNGMREAAKRMGDGGRIISLSTSIVGTYLPAHGVYVATKAAVEALTHVLAKELGPRGVTVNAVAPGPIGTELFFTGRSPAMIERIVQDIPMGRLGTPEEVARVVSFLAGPDGGWVSGQVIRANGGRN